MKGWVDLGATQWFNSKIILFCNIFDGIFIGSNLQATKIHAWKIIWGKKTFLSYFEKHFQQHSANDFEEKNYFELKNFSSYTK